MFPELRALTSGLLLAQMPLTNVCASLEGKEVELQHSSSQKLFLCEPTAVISSYQ